MTKRLSLLAAAAAVALFGLYQFADSTNAGDDQEYERDKCIENCG
jgi:hypothetical protein